MGGQIIDATLVPAPRQRMNRDEKQAVKDGVIPEDWQANPKKCSQKDCDARWTVQVMKGRRREDGQMQPDLVIPFFGYKNHISVDRRHLFIRSSIGTDAASADGPRLREGLVVRNTSSQVWADTAYRSAANEEYLEKHGKVSLIHRKKPKGKPMPTRIRKANAKKSSIRARIEHVFADEKGGPGFVIRTIGLARAKAAMLLKNITYNMKRLCFLSEEPR